MTPQELLRAAFAHGEPATARPITVFPQARTEHLGNGATHEKTCETLAAALSEVADLVQPKGTGVFWTPGRTLNGRKRDCDCNGIGWLAFDHDAGVTWDRTLAALESAGAAFVAYESPSATETVHKWRLAMPLRSEWTPNGDANQNRHRWKKQLYATAREALTAATGAVFDPSTDAFLNRFYPCAKRAAEQKPRRVAWRDGAAFDIEALWQAAVAAGLAENRPAPVYVEPADGERPLIAAFEAAGWIRKQLGEKVAVRCPWESTHESGHDGDTSTVIFAASGVFHCSHAHCKGKRTQADVVDMLPDKARDVYDDLRDELDEPAPIPAHYPAPTENKDAAIARQNETIRAWVATATKQGAALAEFRRLRKQSRDEIERTRSYAAGPFSETVRKAEQKRIVGEKRAATHAIRLDVERRHGAKIDAAGDRVLICGAQGTGKTRTTLQAIAEIPGDVVVRVYCQTLAKADETAAEYAEHCGAASMPAFVVRGRAAMDPAKEKKRMCQWFRLAQDAAAIGVNVGEEICPTCPHREGCGYREQNSRIKELRRGLFLMSQDYAFAPCPAPTAHLAVFDEGATAKAAGKTEFSPDRITSQDVEPDVQETLATIRAAVEEYQGRELAELRGAVELHSIEKAAKALRALEERTENTLAGATGEDEIRAAIDALETSEAHKVYLLVRQILREWPTGRDALCSVVFDPDAEVTIDGKKERQARVNVHYLKSPRIGQRAPVLILDGTGSPELNRRLFGERVRTERIAIERNAHVVQVAGRTFGERDLGVGAKTEKSQAAAAQLRNQIRDYILKNRGPRTLVVTYKGLIPDSEKTEARHGMALELAAAGVELAHFGALRGLNTWEDCDTIFVVGRTQPTHEGVRNLARPWAAGDKAPLPTGTAEYTRRETRGRRMRDGTVQGEPVTVADDPRCQALLEQIREAEIVQAVDRLRLVFNGERKRVYLLTSIVVDLDVDSSATWNELQAGGSKLEIAAKRFPDVLPLSGEWLATNLPDVFGSKRTAERIVNEIKQLKTATFLYNIHRRMAVYRIGGQRRPSYALIGPNVSDPQAALERLLGGAVASFELPGEPAPLPVEAEPSPTAGEPEPLPAWAECEPPPCVPSVQAEPDPVWDEVLDTMLAAWPARVRDAALVMVDKRAAELRERDGEDWIGSQIEAWWQVTHTLPDRRDLDKARAAVEDRLRLYAYDEGKE